jgi:hypothetical protein
MHYLMIAYWTIRVFNKIRLQIQLGLKKLIKASLFRNHNKINLSKNLKKRGKVKMLLMCRTNKLKLLLIKILLKLMTILKLKLILKILQIIRKKSISSYKKKIYKKNQSKHKSKLH